MPTEEPTQPSTAPTLLLNARNEVIRRFLRTEAEWLWWVDTDMGFPLDIIECPDRRVSRAAVELAKEKMVVLGQLAAGVDPKSLKVGMQMELVLDTLYEDKQSEYLVWKWKPASR